MSGTMIFADRRDAGRILASRLPDYRGRPDAVVLALPRGGIPVAYEIGQALGLPVDVFVVRKLGVPGREELAMGAIAAGGTRVINYDVVDHLSMVQQTIDMVTEKESEELHRRELAYRGNRPPLDLRQRTAILVDDGVATGSTMRAAIGAMRQLEPNRIVVAVPVAAPEIYRLIRADADEVVSVVVEPLYAISQWYERFEQVGDEEARDLLERAA
jgi:putative phosphoribosyl transferase